MRFLILGSAAALAVVLALACPVHTSFESIPKVVYDEWAIAQARLVPYVGDEFAYDVWPASFNWKEYPGPFECDGIEGSNGCFRWLRREIAWNILEPKVIRHEAQHAILWKLGDERWRCVEHTC